MYARGTAELVVVACLSIANKQRAGIVAALFVIWQAGSRPPPGVSAGRACKAQWRPLQSHEGQSGSLRVKEMKDCLQRRS